MKTGAIIERAPCVDRPALGNRQQGDVVAGGIIGLVIHVGRRLGHRGEDLQHDTAFAQAW